jgi:hypothetical protein
MNTGAGRAGHGLRRDAADHLPARAKWLLKVGERRAKLHP